MTRRFFSTIAGALSLFAGTLSADSYIYTLPPQYAVVEIPVNFHVASLIDMNQGTIQFEDESRWKFPDSDIRTLLSWRQGDFVTLSINRGWFTDYPYCLTNQANGSWISVNPLSGPAHNSPFAHHITGMDHNTPGIVKVYLDGKTCWSIHSDDCLVASKWQVNDTVIFAVNDEWVHTWITGFDTILIDVETNTRAKARRM